MSAAATAVSCGTPSPARPRRRPLRGPLRRSTPQSLGPLQGCTASLDRASDQALDPDRMIALLGCGSLHPDAFLQASATLALLGNRPVLYTAHPQVLAVSQL